MTLRPLVSSLGFVAMFCLASSSMAQEPEKSAPVESKPKADPTKLDEKKVEPKLEKAYFAGGCFWCMEAVFERVKGVKQVVAGYSGGSVSRPTYEMVCTDLTGHAESIGVEYDANVVTYDELLDVFWIAHDPTTLNRQGPDEGTHYRSVIFYADEAQRKLAQKSIQAVAAAGLYRDPIVTQIVPLEKFWVAEKYHQDYFRFNANKNPYCQSVIAPKLAHMKEKLAFYKAEMARQNAKK